MRGPARRRRPLRGRSSAPRTASCPVGLTREATDPLMELAVLLPIAAFIALAAGLVVVLQRTGRIVARTRELEVFKTNVIDLASRVDSSLGGAAGQIDAVRRRQLAPDAIGETLEAATDAVEKY